MSDRKTITELYIPHVYENLCNNFRRVFAVFILSKTIQLDRLKGKSFTIWTLSSL